MTRVFIDPGRQGCGLAIAGHDGELLHAAYIGARGGVINPLLEPVDVLIEYVGAVLVDVEFSVFIEKPRVYDTAHQKGDQRDIINLAIIVGALMKGLGKPTALAEPAEWKGQVPKDVMEVRIREALSAGELEAIDLPKQKSLHHNVWDAVGMALKFHRRIK